MWDVDGAAAVDTSSPSRRQRTGWGAGASMSLLCFFSSSFGIAETGLVENLGTVLGLSLGWGCLSGVMATWMSGLRVP